MALELEMQHHPNPHVGTLACRAWRLHLQHGNPLSQRTLFIDWASKSPSNTIQAHQIRPVAPLSEIGVVQFDVVIAYPRLCFHIVSGR